MVGIRSVAEIAAEILWRMCLVCRATLDSTPLDEDARLLHADLVRWAEDHVPELSAAGQRTLAEPLGSLELDLRTEWVMLAEPLAMLIWSLGRASLPPHDQGVRPTRLAQAVHFLADDCQDWLTSAPGRPVTEIESLRHTYRLGLRAIAEGRLADDPARQEAHAIHASVPFCDGELEIVCQPASQVPEDWRQLVALLFTLRLTALDWLLDQKASLPTPSSLD